MNAKSVFTVGKATVTDWLADNATRLSAALSLYTLLSLAPLLVITLKIVAVVLRDSQRAQDQLRLQMTNLMGGQAAEAIDSMLKNGQKHNSGVLAAVLSLVILLFSAAGVFGELQDSMNTIWGVKAKPNQGIWMLIQKRLLSLGMVFGIAFLLMVSMFVSTILTTAAKYVLGDASFLAILADLVASFIVMALLFASIFKFLPDVKLAWRHVWVGALVTAALFIVGKYGLAMYFKYATPTSAYGAAGSLVAVLLWVYYSSFILFFGAEFTKVWTRQTGDSVIPEEHAMKITEDDRANLGIPSPKRIDQSMVASEPAPRPLPSPIPPKPVEKDTKTAVYIVGAGLLAGALAGRLVAKHQEKTA